MRRTGAEPPRQRPPPRGSRGSMTEYGRGPGSEPWHPEDPLYGDGGWGGQAADGQPPTAASRSTIRSSRNSSRRSTATGATVSRAATASSSSMPRVSSTRARSIRARSIRVSSIRVSSRTTARDSSTTAVRDSSSTGAVPRPRPAAVRRPGAAAVPGSGPAAVPRRRLGQRDTAPGRLRGRPDRPVREPGRRLRRSAARLLQHPRRVPAAGTARAPPRRARTGPDRLGPGSGPGRARLLRGGRR